MDSLGCGHRKSIFLQGTPVTFEERKTYAAHPLVWLNSCAENFPISREDFGLTSLKVPLGYQEQKAYCF